MASLEDETEIEEDVRREFIRASRLKQEPVYRFDRRTYSTAPRLFECYSCMSMSYQESWDHLSLLYLSPKAFTNRCNDPFAQEEIPTVPCSTMCVSLLEPNVEGGIFLGYKFIRGCVDKLLKHNFNQSALRTHRFNQHNQCRSLPRAQLFNIPRSMDVPLFGDVQLCSCFGDKCNGASTASSSHPRRLYVYLAVFLLVLILR